MSVVSDIIKRHPGLLPVNSHESQFVQHLSASWNRFSLFKLPEVKNKVKEVVPIDELEAKCAEILVQLNLSLSEGGETGHSDYRKEDAFFQCLLEWFKHDFFKWFNKGFCEKCQTNMAIAGRDQPRLEETSWLASIVEVYQCEKCKAVERFPRYNHPLKLLETRRGRCGEWRTCFTAICITLNYEMRLVDDWHDHVWNEVYLPSQQRWIHCDCCENAFDTPLMYETGWGKKQTYCIAVSEYEVQDVTWRYTKEPNVIIDRRKNLCREHWLSRLLLKLSSHLQRKLPAEQKEVCLNRRIKEIVSFLWIPGENKQAKDEELRGRISGDTDWKSSRDERPEPNRM